MLVRLPTFLMTLYLPSHSIPHCYMSKYLNTLIAGLAKAALFLQNQP